jgi:hypothetical protein
MGRPVNVLCAIGSNRPLANMDSISVSIHAAIGLDMLSATSLQSEYPEQAFDEGLPKLRSEGG